MARHKYGAKPTTVDGHRFDSQMEARRYAELKLLEQAGDIKDLELQPRFELQPSFTHRGKHQRAIHYVADFAYLERSSGWRHVVEDVKGARTKIFNLKLKLLYYRYPDIEFRMVQA